MLYKSINRSYLYITTVGPERTLMSGITVSDDCNTVARTLCTGDIPNQNIHS